MENIIQNNNDLTSSKNLKNQNNKGLHKPIKISETDKTITYKIGRFNVTVPKTSDDINELYNNIKNDSRNF